MTRKTKLIIEITIVILTIIVLIYNIKHFKK